MERRHPCLPDRWLLAGWSAGVPRPHPLAIALTVIARESPSATGRRRGTPPLQPAGSQRSRRQDACAPNLRATRRFSEVVVQVTTAEILRRASPCCWVSCHHGRRTNE